MKNLIDDIFAIQNEADFNRCALAVFRYQREKCSVYRTYLAHLKRPEPTHYFEIPFLPIGFFKTHVLLSSDMEATVVFKSSGTTGMARSAHYVADVSVYERSFVPTYEHFIGPLNDQVIFALLPNYVEQGESSLVYMVDHLIRKTNNSLSGFYLNDFTALEKAIRQALSLGKKCVLFGVSYALLDFAETQPDLSQVVVIETGGMKGRRKEMTKEELHAELKAGFSCATISSEYGMSELLSQAYSNKDGLFDLPPWMRVHLRDINDPFSSTILGKTGGVNVIDLANIYSCSFLETQDLGRIEAGKLRLMGRFDQADVRGCNLLVE